MVTKTKTEEAVTEEVVAAEETVTEDVQTVGITAGDLSTMVKVIDAGSSRGAWRGEELATIGGLRDKLVAVVNSIAPAAEEETPVEETAVEETPEEGKTDAA